MGMGSILLVSILALSPGMDLGRILARPARIQLVPPRQLVAGKEAILTIRLTGPQGRPVPAPQDWVIQLEAPAEVQLPPQVSIRARSSEASISFIPSKPGVWKVTAKRVGLYPASLDLVCISEVNLHAAIPVTPGPGAILHGFPAAKVAPQPPVAHGIGAVVQPPAKAPPAAAPPPPSSGGGTAGGSAPPPAPAGGPAATEPGRLSLLIAPSEVHRHADGWENTRVSAIWMNDQGPVNRASDLAIQLHLEGAAEDFDLEPTTLEIPAGAYQTSSEAILKASAAGTANVRALYAGGSIPASRVEFLLARPTAIALTAGDLLGLATVRLPADVQLVDPDGAPTESGGERTVSLRLEGPSGIQLQEVKFQPGQYQEVGIFNLARQGKYHLSASSLGLLKGGADFSYRLDWTLIGIALVGGVVGSGASLHWRERRKGRRLHAGAIVVALMLGILSALLLLLLASFGVLSAIQGTVPETWSALSRVPVESLPGAFLLGLVGGLGFELILGSFASQKIPLSRPAAP
jgi:hypothetical protein